MTGRSGAVIGTRALHKLSDCCDSWEEFVGSLSQWLAEEEKHESESLTGHKRKAPSTPHEVQQLAVRLAGDYRCSHTQTCAS